MSARGFEDAARRTHAILEFRTDGDSTTTGTSIMTAVTSPESAITSTRGIEVTTITGPAVTSTATSTTPRLVREITVH